MSQDKLLSENCTNQYHRDRLVSFWIIIRIAITDQTDILPVDKNIEQIGLVGICNCTLFTMESIFMTNL